MRHRFVIAESEVDGVRADGDTAVEQTTWDRSSGSQLLEQRVVRFARGRSRTRSDAERDELLYVVSGRATLVLGDEEHALEPMMGAYVRAGEEWAVDNDGPEELHVVAVSVPAEGARSGARRVTVRFDDQPEQRADDNRTFRYLVNGAAGSTAATQFVGLVQPCRAPDHSHSYDEVGYIVEGRGFAHVGGESIPLGPGSSFHLPPEQVHCIENTGPGVMRILGVFYPSGDPASRTYDEAASTAEGGSR
ncbi:MAG TPA: cupin domain-containing protein [Gaiellaceae bacterium]|nr:cupin domain-containing protein [Gaiellaceae bacterium]